jgi:hypothetical protein
MTHRIKAAELEPIAGDYDPYDRLVKAIFQRAVKDLHSKNKDRDATLHRNAAKEWLGSRCFEEFCADFLDLGDARIAKIRQALDIQPPKI